MAASLVSHLCSREICEKGSRPSSPGQQSNLTSQPKFKIRSALKRRWTRLKWERFYYRNLKKGLRSLLSWRRLLKWKLKKSPTEKDAQSSNRWKACPEVELRWQRLKTQNLSSYQTLRMPYWNLKKLFYLSTKIRLRPSNTWVASSRRPAVPKRSRNSRRALGVPKLSKSHMTRASAPCWSSWPKPIRRESSLSS